MGKVKVRIEVGLSFYNEFFIGGGKGISNIDNYILKDINGLPYIPGSMLKGKLRYNFSRIYEMVSEKKCKMSDSGEKYCGCYICEMFGEKENSRGSLYFSNLEIYNNGINKSNLYSVRNGIQINRYLKTTNDQSLFNTQTSGQAGELKFSGKIEGYLKSSDYRKQLILLYTALKFTDSLGASQSRGLGWLSDDKKIKIYVDNSEVTKQNLLDWREEVEV